MSDILSRWLNEELELSQAVDPKTFARDFSSGYLIGEVLHKYQLQNDFSMFVKKDSSICKLNNFTRVEPTLRLLGISFDTNTAQELMQEKQGVATRLLYQLYASLEKKKKAEISSTLMEIMQPAAIASLHKKEHEYYSDRLHRVVRRDAELKLQKISQHYEEKCQQLDERPVVTQPTQQKRQLRGKGDKRLKNIELRVCRQKYSDAMTCNQGAIVQVPKPPPYTSKFNLKRRQQQQQRREQQAQTVQTEITQFETRKKLVTYGFASSSSGQPLDFPLGRISQDTGRGATLTLQSNSKYVQDIRQRLEENAVAREQREKRRDRFLVEQLQAHEAQEEALREEQLVKRLTRQTQQEQRLTTQLLQIHVQKDVIRKNRLFREQQYQQRRERDFQEALEREAALAQQAKLDRAEEIRKELEFCNRIAAERAQGRHKKHFKICKDILEQIVDLATKVGEYRLHTGNLIPAKPMREWKELLFSGLPLYEPIKCQEPGFSAPLDPVELEKQEILKKQDYDEYTNMVGEWAWPEEAGQTKLPPTNNNILGHVVLRVRNIVHPPVVKPSPPPFPHFTIKACVLGKLCSGKTTCLAGLAEAHGIYVLSVDSLIEEALNAYHDGEKVTEQQEERDHKLQRTSSTSEKLDLDTQEESRGRIPSTRAMQGAAAEKELKEGNTIPNELLVDIVVEAIRQVPAQSGWILDGFPVDINQAHLLEKALGGSVEEGNGVLSSVTELAADPNPPEPAPPAPPALDLALLLDVPDECVIGRPFSQMDNAAASTSQPTDKNLYLAQIPQRITAFQDTWPKLEKWFVGRQNILVRVDANVDEVELHKRVESALQRVMMQTQEALADPSGDDLVLDSGKALGSSSSASPQTEEQPQGLTHEAHAESYASPDKKEDPSVKSLPKSNKLRRAPSRKASTSSVTNEDSQGVPENPAKSASPCPGSSGWVYVDEPLPPELPEYLCPHWDTVCDSYVNNVKAVMHQLRSQRSVIDLHLFNIREEYKQYMGRPDLKQELVSHWQKDFNSIPDDMRQDEDTKAELHHRLDELCERLWDICDKRKEKDEKEKDGLMADGWLEEHTALLVNHHSLLLQVELDRFQDTLRILKVYYLSMCRQVLPELPSKLDCIPLLEDERRPDSKTKRQAPPESVKSPHEKLISDYGEACKAISHLVSAEAHQGEMKEQKEGARTNSQEVINKIHKEYAAALHHEGNAAKSRIALVRGHGLVMVQSLQSRAEQTSSSMQESLEAHYLAGLKSVEQLSEVVGHHIQAGAKLQKELVLECTDFHLNGDCHMVASPAPPPRPPPHEKPMASTPTVTQLESLRRMLHDVAPSGLISNYDLFSLLMDIISVSLGRNTLPEPWLNMDETQLLEIVSLLKDSCELIDWRRFLLSAALPWPFPSSSQLLDVLRRFKAADTGNTAYVNEEQYLQTKLWFSDESGQPVPEDPSEPLPNDRLANLRKFFFQLFADRSFSPPRLDYVCMLQYFAADPDPRQGFIRALSVVLGQHLMHSSASPLVKSMPSMQEAAQLSSSDPDADYKVEDFLCASSASLGEKEVSIPALLAVICHKAPRARGGSALPPGSLSPEEHTEQLVRVFRELGYTPEDCAPFSVLSQHPFIQHLMETSTHHQLVNIHTVLLAHQDEGQIPEG
uniref:sperm flagellar protein 2 isoform X2 n=1 Tax=Gasterosteus aculeatus aculeatus TaxID=481459 RepID=UPI001A99D440|nr:sperm flagellar protein 2 isoform X2 [Gasterosteus aculeatus aculeatus]